MLATPPDEGLSARGGVSSVLVFIGMHGWIG
jgi:hypothetical protein